MRVFVFGDSITQGYWGTDGGWVNCIRKHYDELQFQDLQGRDEPTIFNLGISADTSADVLARIAFETKVRTRPHHQPPIAVVQIGVNDSSIERGEPRVTPEQYKSNLAAIIKQAKPLCAKIVFVGLSSCIDEQCSPVVWDSDYCYSNERIKAYEDIMHEVAAAHSVPFIPVFDAFMAELKQDKSILPDGLHPDNKGHQIIVDIVLPQLEELLS